MTSEAVGGLWHDFPVTSGRKGHNDGVAMNESNALFDAGHLETVARTAAAELRAAANTETASIYQVHPEGGYALWASDRDPKVPFTVPETPRLWWDRERGWQLRDNGYYFIAPLGEEGALGLAVCGPWLNSRLGPRRALLISGTISRTEQALRAAADQEVHERDAEAAALARAVEGLIPDNDTGLQDLLLRAVANEVDSDEVRFEGGDLVIVGAKRRSEAPVRILADALARLGDGGDVQLMALEALADAVDARASHTVGHSDRVRSWSVGIAVEMNLAPDAVRSIEIAAKLHDLATGFCGREALYKAKLDDSERTLIQKHSELGAEILHSAGYPDDVCSAVKGHHERWDGAGYPAQLTGEDIPLGARIIALPEVFDALTSARPWREPLPIAKAVESLLEGAGTQFDPEVVSAFLAAWWNSTPKPQRRFITYEN